MSTHQSIVRAIDREAMAGWYRRTRERTQRLFEIPLDEVWYDRPIPLRNPIVFYEGHLPAFAVNTLVKLAQRGKGIDAHFESLFERGIDPEDETAVRDPAEMWPSREDVQQYGREADALVERALLNVNETDPVQVEAASNIVEHELMHQETLLYMFHNVPYSKKTKPVERDAALSAAPREKDLTRSRGVSSIPSGPVTLGADGTSFGWDNEFPQHVVEVPAFEIDRLSVTNGDYLAYMKATGAAAPHFWTAVDGEWFWRGMFEMIPLPLDWPVWVTHDEAAAYARRCGRRLPTEAEYGRAALGASGGNFDFASWDPDPVGSHPDTVSRWGVHDLIGNGWEWTSTVFDGFDGFRPMATYPRYSADFFDGQHYVMKGASPATGRELVRPSFRNWFRPNYPYVWAKFRTVQ
ncbi:MAG TPA: SUMF1/EgtB/PvdO family nonheme iron enzyme [Thermoanaerobaculia bacterium]|nr:SUMF1/EgtB/PvdO family nonheme iron enzyme [Thermoanaerobaculia bacterium]